MAMEELTALAKPGSTFEVRVTPKASRNVVKLDPGPPPTIRVYVTAVPEGGKATAAVGKLLAKAIGVAKSDLELLRGATSRVKVFRVRG
ncbi:MAG: DUF167 domain-containing protein [Rhodobacteraceae bacterium]|nr:DUF167 domain-containing protein [Paracoccaceae bacterium]